MAAEAAKALGAEGIKSRRRVHALLGPCSKAQDAGYRASVLGPAPRVAIEAAIPFGWDRYMGEEAAASSACTASAPARPPRRCTSISALRLRPWRKRRRRFAITPIERKRTG